MNVVQGPLAEEDLGQLVWQLDKVGRAQLRRFRLPPEDAEDILQDALLLFLQKRATVHSPEAWLCGTLRKRCLVYWRNRRRRLLSLVDRSLLEDRASVDPRHVGLGRDLQRAVRKLPPRCQQLLALRYGKDHDPREAAAELGYQPSGAYKLLDRCLTALTRCLVAIGFMEESDVPT